MAQKNANKTLPIIIISVIALAAGLFVALQLSGADNNTSSESSEAKAQLVELQASLKTSLALPLDFKSVPEFDLIDAQGKAITQEALTGKWSLMFFGFTHCPDVCPTTLHIMKNVIAKLEEQGKALPQIIFVSVDPNRDTSERMKEYIAYFDERFIGITGELNKVHAMTSSLGIVASFTANDSDPDNYGVDHTASLLLIDPEGRLRAKVTPPLEADNIVSDYLNVSSAPN